MFVDFKQAYDSVKTEDLYEIMGGLKIPSKIILMVRVAVNITKGKVLVEGKVSHKFQVNKGLRETDSLSICLFNFVL